MALSIYSVLTSRISIILKTYIHLYSTNSSIRIFFFHMLTIIHICFLFQMSLRNVTQCYKHGWTEAHVASNVSWVCKAGETQLFTLEWHNHLTGKGALSRGKWWVDFWRTGNPWILTWTTALQMNFHLPDSSI